MRHCRDRDFFGELYIFSVHQRQAKRWSTNQSWKWSQFEYYFMTERITQFTSNWICRQKSFFHFALNGKLGATIFFCLRISIVWWNVCQMTKNLYLLVRNMIGEVMWHVTYYLSLSLLIASVHTHTQRHTLSERGTLN